MERSLSLPRPPFIRCVSSAGLGTLVLTRDSGHDDRSAPRTSLEAELAEQPVIIAGVGVGVGGHNGGQPVLYI